MFHSILKAVLIASLTSVLAGCFLELNVPTGGDVQSDSGTRDCLESTICSFETTDTDLNESFMAVARPGYKFVKWQEGDAYLCAGQTDPTCVTNNTIHTGNPTVEAFIATDNVLKIKPVFEVVLTPRYVLRDGNGESIGDVTRIRGDAAFARLEHADGDSVIHGYEMKFTRDTVRDGDAYPFGWASPTCTGNAIYISPNLNLFRNMAPLFSKDYKVVRDASGGFHLARLAMAVESNATWYTGDINNCTASGTGSRLPATIEVHDISSLFTPPFSLHSE